MNPYIYTHIYVKMNVYIIFVLAHQYKYKHTPTQICTSPCIMYQKHPKPELERSHLHIYFITLYHVGMYHRKNPHNHIYIIYICICIYIYMEASIHHLYISFRFKLECLVQKHPMPADVQHLTLELLSL